MDTLLDLGTLVSHRFEGCDLIYDREVDRQEKYIADKLILLDTIPVEGEKAIDKIEMLEEGGGYSEESRWMADGRMYGTSYDDGTSYARGRNAKRDSMGRYSSEGEHHRDGMSYGRGGNMGGHGGYSREGAKEHMIEKMEAMMEEAESPKEREAIRQCIHKLENA